jgi:hypothetical protein
MHELFALDSLIIHQLCDKPGLYGFGSYCRETEPVNQNCKTEYYVLQFWFTGAVPRHLFLDP